MLHLFTNQNPKGCALGSLSTRSGCSTAYSPSSLSLGRKDCREGEACVCGGDVCFQRQDDDLEGSAVGCERGLNFHRGPRLLSAPSLAANFDLALRASSA
jgi:hypothetical protein